MLPGRKSKTVYGMISTPYHPITKNVSEWIECVTTLIVDHLLIYTLSTKRVGCRRNKIRTKIISIEPRSGSRGTILSHWMRSNATASSTRIILWVVHFRNHPHCSVIIIIIIIIIIINYIIIIYYYYFAISKYNWFRVPGRKGVDNDSIPRIIRLYFLLSFLYAYHGVY